MATNLKPPANPYPESCLNHEAEQGLLGAMMIEPRLVDDVTERVTADDFADPFHRVLFERIVELSDSGKSLISPLLLKPLCPDQKSWDYLVSLTSAPAAIIAATDYASQIADLAKRRRLIDEAHKIIERASDVREETSEALTADIDAMLTQATTRKTKRHFSLVEVLDASMKDIEDEAAGRKSPGVKVQFLPDWNDVVGGGMRGGEVIILGGRPGMGKTACGLTVSLGAAANDHGTLVISKEMRAQQLGRRLWSDLIFDHGRSASFDDVKRGRFSKDDRYRIDQARKRAEAMPWFVTDDTELTIERLPTLVRRYQRLLEAKGQKLELVVLDYLQLLKSANKRAKIYEEVSDVSRMLKQVALATDVAVLALAQLSRDVEKREDKRPLLSDLRDSGQIEQDADGVVFLYREEYYLKQAEPERGHPKYEDWSTSMQRACDRLEIYSAKVRDADLARRLCYFFADRQAVRGSRYFEERGMGV